VLVRQVSRVGDQLLERRPVGSACRYRQTGCQFRLPRADPPTSLHGDPGAGARGVSLHRYNGRAGAVLYDREQLDELPNPPAGTSGRVYGHIRSDHDTQICPILPNTRGTLRFEW
jgi:hypothetical protein